MFSPCLCVSEAGCQLDRFGQVLRQASIVTLLGIGVGTAGAILAARTFRSFLFGLKATDPSTLILAISVLSVTALIASYLPARRAAGIDPMVTLRTE